MDTFVGTCDEDGGHVCVVWGCSRELAKVSVALSRCKELLEKRSESPRESGGGAEEDEDEICKVAKGIFGHSSLLFNHEEAMEKMIAESLNAQHWKLNIRLHIEPCNIINWKEDRVTEPAMPRATSIVGERGNGNTQYLAAHD